MMRPVAVLVFAVWMLAGLLGVARSVAQGVDAGVANFQTIVVDPYSQALGEATVALRGYPGAASLNPATIGRPNTVQVGSNWDTSAGGFFQTPWWFDGFWLTSPAIDVRLRRWAFAYQFKQFTLDSPDFRDARNNPLGKVTDRSHKIAAAYDLRPNLTVGLGVNLISTETGGVLLGSELARSSASGVSFDFGIVYDRTFDVPHVWLKPSVGWSLTDFGKPVRFEGATRDDPLTMVMRGGLSLQAESKKQRLRRPLITAGLHGGLSRVLVGFDEGNVFDPYGPFEALVKTWKSFEVRTNPLNDEPAEFEKVGVLDQLSTQAGLEVTLLQIVALRLGNYHTPKYVGDRHYTSYGFGVDLYYVALDYSKVNIDESLLDEVIYWRLTARVPLTSSPDNFWPDLLSALRR